MSMLRKCALTLMAIVMASHPLASCTKNGTPSETEATTSAVTSPPEFDPMDLEGRTFRFLSYDEDTEDYADSYIWADSMGGETISQAVAERNRDTESQFNIKIETDRVHSPKVEAARRMQSGQVDFDVIYELGIRTVTLALNGRLYDFGELEGVDLDRSYWLSGARDDLTVGGKMYLAASYITMNSIGGASCVIFNNDMYEDLGYSESLYSMVDSKKWVIDKYVELALAASEDVDNDGIMTINDRYGLWGDTTACLTELARNAGIRNTQKNGDGSYSLSMYTETAVDIYTRFDHILGKDKFIGYDQVWEAFPNLTAFPSRYKLARTIGFGEDHVLFMNGNVNMVLDFGHMNDDFGVLPNPLYNSEQTEYYHYIDVNTPMFAVPAESLSIDVTGTILEYMAYKSEVYLLPAYYSAVARQHEGNPTDDGRMLDIIRGSMHYEWTDLYDLDTTNGMLADMMTSGCFNTVFTRTNGKALDEINECVDILRGLK